jgi:hypothetical protein
MVNLYRSESSDAKRNAQRNLAGRTHYVDDDTLRYFRARVLSARIVSDGLLFAILESASANPNHSKRIFRYVIFDLFGFVLARPDIEHSFSRQQQAEKAMWAALDAIDAKAVTLAAIKDRRASNERELDNLTIVVNAIDAQSRAA